LDELVTWSPKKCAQAIYSLRLVEPSQDLTEAAFVMHAEASLELMKLENEDLGYWHVTFARTVNGFMSDPDRESWLKEYLLFMGYHFQRPGIQPLDGPSMEFFEEALDLFPEDPHVLLALGSMIEAVGRLEDDKGKLEKAAEYYQQCVVAAPDLVEARLRLGATNLALGYGKEAKRELNRVSANAKNPYLVYLAGIFLGDYYKTEGRWHEAVQAYESAAKTMPEWQVACLSLSHALQRFGNRSRSSEIMKRCLELPAKTEEYEDGWWRYQLGQSHRVETLLERWRKEVRP
jgi:tetratricopeptide (TPR) repeat protein